MVGKKAGLRNLLLGMGLPKRWRHCCGLDDSKVRLLTHRNRKVAGVFGALGNAFKDPWAQVRYSLLPNELNNTNFVKDADVIAKAAVAAGLTALKEDNTPKVWIVGQSDIIKLGRTTWPAFSENSGAVPANNE